ncbi:DUF2637 domain-containing protein [Streptomyces sp. PTM05]|uniref:DUF2637 domain-containing protein n=1 Tax=Streptantibioticus parmotrematis TaxID=2873249 RepID=A0ABS7QVU6_9ACTN|nr:DUF2637 domain-containing protein [Streptantibioticus parmotrematis]MBY8886831.1 DUF2637 domain-containing protein [Streptantibioticus parmotrematis]
MSRKIRPDAVLVQAVIAGALSFAHLHDIAEAAGQDGWKAWAYPISVDLLLVAAWHRIRTLRADHHAARAAWSWFGTALIASLGANIATAGLLDLHAVPIWLRILVAGWPALAFLGGTLLVHTPADPAPQPSQSVDERALPEVELRRDDEPEPAPEPVVVPAPELPAAAAAPVTEGPVVPPALLDHARKIADAHRATAGEPLDRDALRARLGLPAPMADAIATHLQLT